MKDELFTISYLEEKSLEYLMYLRGGRHLV